MKTRIKRDSLIIALLLVAGSVLAREYHVAKYGNDTNTGTASNPFLTIQQAANLAQPGDVITVHEGVYRERVNPPRGGESEAKRIVYRAASGEKVVIKGSEIIKGWKKVKDDVWEVALPNSFFGDFNPYSDTLYGHWFNPLDRKHHTGAVYLNGDWLPEAASNEDIMKPLRDKPMWFGSVDDKNTLILAQFPDVDPNKEEVEINVRQTVFFPDQAGLNYITVKGFTMSQAATPWAPPTTKQLGLIGPHWSKGWIIEDNIISHSRCVGISLGLAEFNKPVTGNAVGFTELVKYLVEKGYWSKNKVGNHIVRGNRILHCEQAGIAGCLGAAFCIIENNEISEIHTQRNFTGMEQGGIKLHGGVDVLIKGNMVSGTGAAARGIWLDWMGQGAVISNNLGFDNQNCDLYLEVNHGPILVVNNIFLSNRPVVNVSRGTAFVHNLFGGSLTFSQTTRSTPYMIEHSTVIAGMHGNTPGDDRFYNNIFAGEGPVFIAGWGGVDSSVMENLPIKMEGNLYIQGAKSHKNETNPLFSEEERVNPELIKKEDGYYIERTSGSGWFEGHPRNLITTEFLGKAVVPGMKFENADGSPVVIDTDYHGKARNHSNPLPGPFEVRKEGKHFIKVWPPEKCTNQLIRNNP